MEIVLVCWVFACTRENCNILECSLGTPLGFRNNTRFLLEFCTKEGPNPEILAFVSVRESGSVVLNFRGFGVSGTIQRPGGVRTPLATGVPVTVMLIWSDFTRIIFLESKMAVQSASQACPTDRRGKWIPGTRWHSVAELGRSMGRLPQDVPLMVCLLAAVIRIPLGVAISFVNGVFSSARLVVQPVSAAM